MTQFRSDAQFSYDEDLLHEGNYREWFWKGLDESSIGFLRSPVKVPSPPPAEPLFRNQEFPQAKRWRDNAACAGADSVVFFGVDGGDLKSQYLSPDAKWRRLCPQCPVRELCLELARKTESVGIFGGKLFHAKNALNGSRNIFEYDEETVPRRGRPKGSKNKPKDFMRVAADKRQLLWGQKQKEINDRISAAAARESLGDQ